MQSVFRLFALVLVVACFLSSDVRAAEKKVFIGGTWYTQAANGSLSICNECNAGRSVPTVATVPASTGDVPTCYPCQMMQVQHSPVKGAACESCPCVSSQSVKSDGRLQLGIGLGCSSGSCSSGVSGIFSRRPIRSFFGRLFGGGCGG